MSSRVFSLRWLAGRGAACLILLAACVVPVSACPWCQTNALMKPTVNAGDPDPGGKFFGRVPDPAKTRHYYIAAEPGQWNFVPTGEDPVKKNPLPPHIKQRPTASKMRFVQYLDDQFQSAAFTDDSLGILGPPLRGVVGEYLAVTFLNRTGRPLSMHPHGVKYDKDSEGASTFPERGLGAAIAPNARFTYVWKLDEASGPRPGKPSSKAWLYHSHVLGDEDVNMGLIGFIIVTDPSRARPDGTPADVDRELASLFMIFDESGMGDADEVVVGPSNLPPARKKTFSEITEIRKMGERHTINGLAFGNLKGLEMAEGERVRWYLFGLGSETDFHTAHWHGARVVDDRGHGADVVELLPASMRTADMLADNPGTWLFHCHVADHMMEGMYANFVVHPRQEPVLSRAPFFPASTQARSIRLNDAKASITFENGGPNGSFSVRGAVTVYNHLSLRTTRMKIQLGGKTVPLALNHEGFASAQGVEFKTLNAGTHGVIPGSILEFEARFQDPQWMAELQKAGVSKSGGAAPRRVDVPFQLSIEKADHRISIPLNYGVKGGRGEAALLR